MLPEQDAQSRSGRNALAYQLSTLWSSKMSQLHPLSHLAGLYRGPGPAILVTSWSCGWRDQQRLLVPTEGRMLCWAYQVGANKVKLWRGAKDRRIDKIPSLLLGSTQSVWEGSYKVKCPHGDQAGEVSEGRSPHGDCGIFWRAIPLCKGASTSQFQKVVALQEDEIVWPDFSRDTRNPELLFFIMEKSPDFFFFVN